jgi:hypothetical protein
MAMAENIRTMQGFIGYFDPAQAERMARGCRVHARRAAEGAKVDHFITERADSAIAENIRTMQGFLGYFDPAQAERMARGFRVGLAGDWLSQALSALQSAFRDWDISIEEAQAEGDQVALRFAVPSQQLQGSWATEPAIRA